MSAEAERQARKWANMEPAEKVENTGFSENFVAQLGLMMDEDTTISRWLNSGLYDERDRHIDRMISDGEINAHQWMDGDDINYSRMSYDLKRQGYDVLDDYDVRDNIRADLTQRREYAQDVASRATGWGAVGGFTGTMVGAQMDPINMAMMFVPGIGWIRGGALMARAAKHAAYYGGLSAASEVAIQSTAVRGWKRDINVEHTLGDSLEVIAIAGLAGGTLSGAGVVGTDMIQRGFKRARNNARKFGTKSDEDAKSIDEISRQQARHDWHVHTWRNEEAARRVEASKKRIREIMNDLDISPEEVGLDKVIEVEEKLRNGERIEPADFEALDPFVDDPLPTARSKQDGRFDNETVEVKKRLEEDQLLDEQKLYEHDEPVVNGERIDDAEWEPPHEETGDPFIDFDEEEFSRMSPSERDAYIQSKLGDEFELDDMIVYEESGLDANGDPMYQTKTKAEIDEEIDTQMGQLDEFMDCWNG